ncbi:MAG TPA: hypothetical protein VF260_02300 [Bacilli bacterium]
MNRSYEVEYCNVELCFGRRHIHDLIKALIQEGYSLYWSESGEQFIISIRSGRKLVKLKFHRLANQHYKLAGTYSFRDEKLAEWMERMIGETRGHAVVKRFRDHQIVVENIMFGELIRLVEISGVEQKVIFQKEPVVTLEEMKKAFLSNRAAERIPVLRMELDYELATLSELLGENRREEAAACKERLEKLRREMLSLEI